MSLRERATGSGSWHEQELCWSEAERPAGLRDHGLAEAGGPLAEPGAPLAEPGGLRWRRATKRPSNSLSADKAPRDCLLPFC